MLKIAIGFAVVLSACSASVTVTQATAVAVTNDEQGTATAVAVFADASSPPDDATSMGMMSSPQAGAVTIPITNVEVFVFQADINGDGSMDTVYWAADDQAAYVWGEIPLECVDDSGNATGETGTADFVYEAASDGYGWLTATDSCGYSTYFGCSGDNGGAETCGGCDFNDDFISCVAESS